MKGVFLVNLGTPQSPSFKDVFNYLIEFLTDSRVINKNWLSRNFLVRGVIVPTRTRTSSKAYQRIWTDNGSPLLIYSEKVKEKLQHHLGDTYSVSLAMRYQKPCIKEQLNLLLDKSLDHLIVLPLFPQYASATTGSVLQKVMELIKDRAHFPRITLLSHFATHPKLIQAFKEAAGPFDLNFYDHVLFSFHGLPQSQLNGESCFRTKGCCLEKNAANKSCYSAQCYAMAQELARALKLPHDKCSLSFQSRLGREPWLQPYTSDVIRQLAHQGKKRVLVFCPSFVCDCLETTFEISTEYREEFIHAGGECLDLVPGLNDNSAWIDALAALVKEAG